MSMFEKAGASVALENNGLNQEEQEKMAREARTGLTNEFLGRVKFLQDAISQSTKEAVVSGNFDGLNKIVESLGADINRLQENYNLYWKDLGPDKK